MDSAALDHSLARRLESVRILEELFESEDAFSHRLWAELAVSGDLDAEVFRWRAFHLAVDSASERGLKVKPIDRYRAEREAAHRHGFLAWDDLAEAFGAGSRTLSILSDYLDRLALAKRWRSELFRQGPLAVASRSDQSS